MFTTTKKLKGLVIRATDGELGKLEHLYFDDETWAIRYLVVETGGWLGGRKVLISPVSVTHLDWENGRLDVSISMKQVEASPNIDLHKPVSRQHEAQYLGYYGYPYYWQDPLTFSPAFYPPPHPGPEAGEPVDPDTTVHDTHLRSTEVVTGYHLEATDGELGHVDTFLVDDSAWMIRYLEVATQNWWPGKKVLIAPGWVERVSWEESKVFVALGRHVIQTCPEFLDGSPITRRYENEVYFHYGRPPYWLKHAEQAQVLPTA